MHVGNYLGLVQASEQQLADAFKQVASHHGDEPDVMQPCQLLATWSQRHVDGLKPMIDRYSAQKGDEPERLNQLRFDKPRNGSLALLRDLHDLWVLASEVQLCWTVLLQAAQGLRDLEMKACLEAYSQETRRQLTWLITRIKQDAPQTLIVAD